MASGFAGGGSFGVWAVAVAGDAKFMLASMRPTDSLSEVLGTQNASEIRERELTMLARAHRELNAPPIIIGGNIRGFAPRDRDALDHLGGFMNVQGEAMLFLRGEWSVSHSPKLVLPDDLGVCVDPAAMSS